MTDVVRGDPASCSQAGGSLLRLSARLRIARRPAKSALRSLAGPERARPLSPALARARRRIDALDEATTALVRQLDSLGSALQAHATDLAEAIAQARAVVERAEAAGLRVQDGVVAPAWGVMGVADPDASVAREATAAALQAELDGILTLLGRRRQRLTSALQDSGALLSDRTIELRG